MGKLELQAANDGLTYPAVVLLAHLSAVLPRDSDRMLGVPWPGKLAARLIEYLFVTPWRPGHEMVR